MNNAITLTNTNPQNQGETETPETIGKYIKRIAIALEKIAEESQTTTVEQPPLETETIVLEFTPDKSDDYFGVVSTSSNHTLPEDERKLSNSGWSIDENGLYLSPANNTNRLLLLSHQSLATNLLKVRYYLYLPSSDFNVSLFTPVQPQTQTFNRYSIYAYRSELRDNSQGFQFSSVIKMPSINFSYYNYLCCEFHLLQKKYNIYETDSTFSQFNLLGNIPLPLVHTGFLIPGFAGISTNLNNRFKKIEGSAQYVMIEE